MNTECLYQHALAELYFANANEKDNANKLQLPEDF